MMKLGKKFLCVFFAAIMMSSMVFANEGYVYENSGEDFLCDTEVSYQAYSSFYVTIPTALGLNEVGEISVTMDNLEEGRHITVYATNVDDYGKIKATNQYGNETDLVIIANNSIVDSDGLIGKFYPGGGELTGSMTFSVDTDGSGMRPGLYNGVISFRVCLESE